MPKFEMAITLPPTTSQNALALAYEAMKALSWPVIYAGDNSIVGTTPKSWKNAGQQMVAYVANDQLNLVSEMVHGETLDVKGINKKNVETLAAKYNEMASATTIETIAQNHAEINELKIATIAMLKEEAATAEEVEKVMKTSKGNLYVTYAIIAINVLIFILMAVAGAGIMEPNGIVHISWGSNYKVLTQSGDWWRLFTNVFLHFGIIHLAMNMYCLYSIGTYLEPMLGKAKYITAYVCTGILASVVSLWWHKNGVNSAGASGAIFGLYGLFLAMLTTNLIPKQLRKPLLQSIGLFVVFNLLYGTKGGVDNSAHIGGLVAGFAIGYLYVYAIKKEKVGIALKWLTPLVVLLTLGSSYTYLQANKVDSGSRTTAQNMVKDASYKDSDKMNKKLEQVGELETKALAMFDSVNVTPAIYVKQLKNNKHYWDDMIAILNETKRYNISEGSHKKVAALISYANLRKQENELLTALNSTENTAEKEKLKVEIDNNAEQLQAVLNGIN
jgi:rhomboid protease GluP